VYRVRDGIPSLLPRDPDAELERYFREVASHLEDGRLAYAPWNQRQLDLQFRLLSHAANEALRRWVPPGSVVLDVGCGHGALLESATPEYRMIGVDFVPEMLVWARRRGYAAVVHADASSLPFPDARFDAVLCTEVLNQYADADRLIAELARVCCPGGRVMISTMNKHSLLRIAFRIARKLRGRGRMPVPMVQRSFGELVAIAARKRLDPLDAQWVLAPSSARAYGRRGLILEALATNFLACFEKRA
jgi:ubiquinone/menaquinone biosynthesis C-methylase UbiE